MPSIEEGIRSWGISPNFINNFGDYQPSVRQLQPVSLDTINKLLRSEDVRVIVTPFGHREIELPGYTGTIGLSDVIEKISNIFTKHNVYFQTHEPLSLQDRVCGLQITDTLREFCQTTDTQISAAGFPTTFFSSIRESDEIPLPERLALLKRHLLTYDPKDFKQEFGPCAGRAWDHPLCDGYVSVNPFVSAGTTYVCLKILAKREAVEQKALLSH